MGMDNVTKNVLSRINSIDKLLPRIGKYAVNGEDMGMIKTLGSFQRFRFNPGETENFYSQEDEN